MEEEQMQNSVSQEVAPLQDSQIHESQPEQISKPPVETQEERDFRALRNRKNELERESRKKDELIERLINSQQVPQKVQEPDELETISDEEFIPKGKQKKLVRKELDPLKKEIEDLKKELHHQKQNQFLNDLKRKYSDFDEVVNAETLAVLEEQEPELAQTIADLKDPYKVGVQTYKYMKAMNIATKVPESKRAREVEQKLDKNSKTVQTPLAYDKRPMAKAFDYSMVSKDKNLKNELYKEMYESASRAGHSY